MGHPRCQIYKCVVQDTGCPGSEMVFNQFLWKEGLGGGKQQADKFPNTVRGDGRRSQHGFKLDLKQIKVGGGGVVASCRDT